MERVYQPFFKIFKVLPVSTQNSFLRSMSHFMFLQYDSISFPGIKICPVSGVYPTIPQPQWCQRKATLLCSWILCIRNLDRAWLGQSFFPPVIYRCTHLDEGLVWRITAGFIHKSSDMLRMRWKYQLKCHRVASLHGMLHVSGLPVWQVAFPRVSIFRRSLESAGSKTPSHKDDVYLVSLN